VFKASPELVGAPLRAGKKISMEEVERHNEVADCWMVYQNKVYDVSNWEDHPGGQVIFSHAGGDFTDVFNAFHPKSSFAALDKFYVGDLDPSAGSSTKPKEQIDFENAYRALRTKMMAAGLFEVSFAYYAYKVLSNLAILGASVACVVSSDSLWVNMGGAVLLALFWQQCGWLAHDFLHHQVFENRSYGDIAGLIIGNLWQGFSVSWWKNKHNTHHSVPNLHESSPQAMDGDPDIDTMPVLAWSLKMAEQAKDSKLGRFFVRYQAVLYFPILLVARISWLHQSWLYANSSTEGTKSGSWQGKQAVKKQVTYPVLEKVGLLLHYSWVIALCAQMPILRGVAFFFTSQFMCGLFLALVFGLGHNGMAVYDASMRPDFWKLQVTTTRNITSNWFVDWFCGGLQYQVDHHLFPMIPRHNLKKTHQLVTGFCKEHSVTYHETNMWVGTKEVLSFLNNVSTEFFTEFPAM